MPAVIKTDLPFEEKIFIKQTTLIDAGIDQVEDLLRGAGFEQVVTRPRFQRFDGGPYSIFVGDEDKIGDGP